MFNNDDWLNQVREEVIDPDREIVDPHHHLWHIDALPYDVDDLLRDTGAGHNVVQTLFMECGSSYREDGPEHLKCIGETEYIAASARKTKEKGGAVIAGIIGHADLRADNLDDVLDAHIAAADGLFRGIRHAGACDGSGAELRIPGPAPAKLYADPAFRRGVQRLGERGLTYDTWHYHHQNRDYLDLAQACPGTTMILDHFGTPLGVGPYAGKRDEIFAVWKDDVAAIAECPNVHAKLGGLAMPDNGYGWHERETPPTSDEVVEAHRKWYTHMIGCFGPERCMFESNFPVDRLSLGYGVYWNAMKKISADLSERAKAAMFAGTARKVYSINPLG